MTKTEKQIKTKQQEIDKAHEAVAFAILMSSPCDERIASDHLRAAEKDTKLRLLIQRLSERELRRLVQGARMSAGGDLLVKG